MSRTTELFATVAAAGAGACIAVVAFGGSPLLVLPAIATVAVVSLATRR